MKHVAAVLLAAVLTLPSPVLAAEGSGFSDVEEGDWFAPYVEVCAEDGLMIGLGDGRFAPLGAVTTFKSSNSLLENILCRVGKSSINISGIAKSETVSCML